MLTTEPAPGSGDGGDTTLELHRHSAAPYRMPAQRNESGRVGDAPVTTP
jgi:hypothetical protein